MNGTTCSSHNYDTQLDWIKKVWVVCFLIFVSVSHRSIASETAFLQDKISRNRFWLTSSSTGRFTSLIPLSHMSFLPSLRQEVVPSFEGLLHFMIHASHSSFKPDVRKTLFFYFVFLYYTGITENENSELCRILIPCPKLETKGLLVPKSNINWETGKDADWNSDQIGFPHQKEETNPNFQTHDTSITILFWFQS